MWHDPSGRFIITAAALIAIGGAVLFGGAGGVFGHYYANHVGATGGQRAAIIAGGVVAGAAVGLTIGVYAAPAIAVTAGVAGASSVATGINAALKWMPPTVQIGFAFEQARGANLPANFPVIDHVAWGVGGVASTVTSFKTVNLLAKTYQQGNRVYNKIMAYARKVENFVGREWANVNVATGPTTQRVLEVGIPPTATQAQAQQIARATADAARFGVNVINTIF